MDMRQASKQIGGMEFQPFCRSLRGILPVRALRVVGVRHPWAQNRQVEDADLEHEENIERLMKSIKALAHGHKFKRKDSFLLKLLVTMPSMAFIIPDLLAGCF